MKNIIWLMVCMVCVVYSRETTNDTITARTKLKIETITESTSPKHFLGLEDGSSDVKMYNYDSAGVDSARVSHVSDTALHTPDSVRAAHVADTCLSGITADSTRASHVADTALHTPDSVRASGVADTALHTPDSVGKAEHADSSDNSAYATEAHYADSSDTAAYAHEAGHADLANTATEAEHADSSDNSAYATEAHYADSSDTAAYAHEAGHADLANTATEAEHADSSDNSAYATEAGHVTGIDCYTDGIFHDVRNFPKGFMIKTSVDTSLTTGFLLSVKSSNISPLYCYSADISIDPQGGANPSFPQSRGIYQTLSIDTGSVPKFTVYDSAGFVWVWVNNIENSGSFGGFNFTICADSTTKSYTVSNDSMGVPMYGYSLNVPMYIAANSSNVNDLAIASDTTIRNSAFTRYGDYGSNYKRDYRGGGVGEWSRVALVAFDNTETGRVIFETNISPAIDIGGYDKEIKLRAVIYEGISGSKLAFDRLYKNSVGSPFDTAVIVQLSSSPDTIGIYVRNVESNIWCSYDMFYNDYACTTLLEEAVWLSSGSLPTGISQIGINDTIFDISAVKVDESAISDSTKKNTDSCRYNNYGVSIKNSWNAIPNSTSEKQWIKVATLTVNGNYGGVNLTSDIHGKVSSGPATKSDMILKAKIESSTSGISGYTLEFNRTTSSASRTPPYDSAVIIRKTSAKPETCFVYLRCNNNHVQHTPYDGWSYSSGTGSSVTWHTGEIAHEPSLPAGTVYTVNDSSWALYSAGLKLNKTAFEDSMANYLGGVQDTLYRATSKNRILAYYEWYPSSGYNINSVSEFEYSNISIPVVKWKGSRFVIKPSYSGGYYGGDLVLASSSSSRAWIHSNSSGMLKLSFTDTTKVNDSTAVITDTTALLISKDTTFIKNVLKVAGDTTFQAPCSLFDGTTYRSTGTAYVSRQRGICHAMIPELSGTITATTEVSYHFPANTFPAPKINFSGSCVIQHNGTYEIGQFYLGATNKITFYRGNNDFFAAGTGRVAATSFSFIIN